MTRQKFDPPPAALAQLSSQALRHRAERVAQLKALVDAGLYHVDAASLVRAMLRRREELPFPTPGLRSLDRLPRAEHLS